MQALGVRRTSKWPGSVLVVSLGEELTYRLLYRSTISVRMGQLELLAVDMEVSIYINTYDARHPLSRRMTNLFLECNGFCCACKGGCRRAKA